MAADKHLIDVPDREEPWPLLFEIADVTPVDSWVLVGGLMVQAHALRAGIVSSRSTRDVDMVIDLATTSVGGVAGPLQKLGFAPVEPQLSTHIHRFVRDDDVVDIMVPRRSRAARWRRFPVFEAPAAAQAISRSDRYEFRTAERSAVVLVPSPLGAIVSKGAAYRADTRDRERHLEDIASLLAGAGGQRALDLSRLTLSDKRHIRHAFAILHDTNHESWSGLDPLDRAIAQRAAAAFQVALVQ